MAQLRNTKRRRKCECPVWVARSDACMARILPEARRYWGATKCRRVAPREINTIFSGSILKKLEE